MTYTKECDIASTQFDVTNFDFWLHETPSDSPVNIIHEGQKITGCFNWTQAGSWPKVNNFPVGSHFKLRVYLEKMGSGEVGFPPWEKIVDIVQGYAADTYTYNFEHVPEPWASLTEGVYKLVITLNLYNAADTYSFFHSFDERGFIEVVKP